MLAYHYGTALELAASCHLDLEDELLEPTSRYLALAGGRAAPLDASAAAAHFARAERVNQEAASPRRWLLSRRTRRTLRRRTPMLVGAVAVIAVALVAALAIWAFTPIKTGRETPKPMTAAQIVDRYGPSVVRITAEAPLVSGSRIRWKRVSASGVVVSTNGLIFTSGRPFVSKTIQGYQPVYVTVEYMEDDGQYQEVTGVFVGGDAPGDVGVVKVDLQGAALRPVPLGDSESVKKGQWVVTLNREGSFLAWAAGKVSDRHYSVRDVPKGQQYLAAMRTSATFEKSPRGGGLIDSKGQLIGVMNDFYPNPETPEYTGRQVAVSIGLFKQQAPEMQRFNHENYLNTAWLGVGLSSIPPSPDPTLGPRPGHGALVEFVVQGSPADAAGILGGDTIRTIKGKQRVLGGDVVVGINGAAVLTPEDLIKTLGRIDPGKTVSLHILRGRSSLTLRVKLAANPLQI